MAGAGAGAGPAHENGAFAEQVGLVVVIDAEAREEQLVLVAAVRALC